MTKLNCLSSSPQKTGRLRNLAGWLIVLIQLLLLFSSYAWSQVKAVDTVGLTVSDMDRAIEFYSGVLTFEKISDIELAGSEIEQLEGVFGARVRVVRMKLGEEVIELTDYLAPEGRPVPIDSRSNDQWFQHFAIIVSDMDQAYKILRQHKVQHASTGPQRLPDWNKNAGGIKAFYFKDPDNHPLEILEFPEGKGDPKWHRKWDRLFLGIDHTAIVVRDTEKSLKFYQSILGFKVAGESENYGVEQEHLNNVFGAKLHITGLRASGGPGIEFLQYLAPGDGRSTPEDVHANDLIHWQTTLRVADLQTSLSALRKNKSAFVSAEIVNFPGGRPFGFSEGLLVRDPDGHAMRIVQQ